MLDLKLLEALPRVPAPVLTVYLNTTPADLRNLRNPSCYLIWLETQAKTLEEGMQKAELRTFRELLQRVEEFLNQSPPQTRDLAIFVGPDYWQAFLLRVDTQDEIFWGLPELSQLLWLVEEHHLAGMVLADRDGTRFYRCWMRELVQEHKEAPKINVWEWRRKDLKPPSNPGVEMLRRRPGSGRHARRIAGRFDARRRDRARNRGTSQAMHQLRLDRSHRRFQLCRLRRPSATLRGVLPRLAKRYKAPLEVIADDAGDRL